MKIQNGRAQGKEGKNKKDLKKHDMEMLVVDGEVKQLQVKLDESVTSKKSMDIDITRLESCYSYDLGIPQII